MKKIISLALVLVMLMGFAACGSSNGTPTEAPTSGADTTGSPSTSTPSGDPDPAEDGGTKVFVYGGDANSATFDPCADLQTKSGTFFLQACGETLWTMDADGNMVPRLALSAEWTEDLTLTVSLRDDVKFSNGNDFTSEDVLYTLQHMAETPRTESMLKSVDMEATAADGDYAVNIVFTAYDAAFIDTLGSSSFCMLDKDSCEAMGGFGWFIGTGPYKLAGDGESDKSGWVESVQYCLVRNENYWGDEPYYDELYCKFYSEESTRYSDLMAGNLDAAYFSEATYINNLANGVVSGSRLAQREMPGVYGLTMAGGEGSNQALSDINLRMAIAHAIDIEAIVTSLGEGVYSIADSVLTDSNWAYISAGVYEYDPELAAEYLAEAGYSASNPLNIRMVAESTAFNSAVAEAVQAYLIAIGINLDLSGMGDFATILPTLISNDFEMSIGGPSNGSGNDPASLLQQFGPSSNNGLLRVTDSELVEFFTSGASSRDKDERIGIYQSFQQKIHDEYLYIPMWIDTLNYGVSDAHSSFEAAIDTNCQFNPCLLTD